jgi:mono/diheme cytochrome c family protein
MPKPPAQEASAEAVAAGFQAYMSYCATCHGDQAISSGLLPDLRRSPHLQTIEAWDAVVREGALAERGMGNFGAFFDQETSAALRAYVIDRAWQAVDK